MPHFYVAHDGRIADAPHWLKQSREKLVKIQQRLNRMQPGSKNYQEAVQKYRELHEHIANQRRDFIHKESSRIANGWDAVCMRNNNLRETSKKNMLPGNVLDSGFGMFRECLRYKLARQGKPLILLDRYTPTSRICSVCGQVHSCDLHRRTVWICAKCGTKHNREVNAAKNIKAQGLAQYLSGQEWRESA